jgi:hypothetical protein
VCIILYLFPTYTTICTCVKLSFVSKEEHHYSVIYNLFFNVSMSMKCLCWKIVWRWHNIIKTYHCLYLEVIFHLYILLHICPAVVTQGPQVTPHSLSWHRPDACPSPALMHSTRTFQQLWLVCRRKLKNLTSSRSMWNIGELCGTLTGPLNTSCSHQPGSVYNWVSCEPIFVEWRSSCVLCLFRHKEENIYNQCEI